MVWCSVNLIGYSWYLVEVMTSEAHVFQCWGVFLYYLCMLFLMALISFYSLLGVVYFFSAEISSGIQIFWAA